MVANVNPLCLDVVLVRDFEQNYVGVQYFCAGHSALEGRLPHNIKSILMLACHVTGTVLAC